ncbi:MAG: phosphatidylinositol mannoside acyltransferase, partial [Janthinobacterium lividum]
MSTVSSDVRERFTATAFRTGWAMASRVPEPLAHLLVDRVADRMHRRGGPRVEQLRRNLRRAVPTASPAELDSVVRAGLRSYARYWCDAFQLPAWDRARTVDTVSFRRGDALRAALRDGGAVAFLGHLGNWDHAAAWSALELAPVVTVAERLRPEAVFQEFLRFRRGLGMEVLALGDPTTFPTLVRRVRAGAFAPLLADRDLSGSGVEVDFLGERVPMAQGPAALAIASGAPLFPFAMHHDSRGGDHAGVLVLDVGAEVPVP